MSGVISDLLPDIDDILGVRDEIGAALKVVKIYTKTWSGSELGDGTAITTNVTITPSPRVVEFKFDKKIPEGGAVKHGDIFLKQISKNAFPTVADVDCVPANKKIEKYYDVGGIQYECIGVIEKHLTWSVHLRRKSHQG